jgi:acetoin utilization protein AcuB
MDTHLTVSSVMTSNPATVIPTDSIRVAIERMRTYNCRRLPVMEAGNLVGLVSDRDLRRATNSPYVLHERWYDDFLLDHIQVKACMTPNPITVTPQTPLIEAATLMRDNKFGGMPVLEGGILVGIITETDLLDELIAMLARGAN